VVTFVLDASAVLRYIDDEAGADRVNEILVAQTQKTATVIISAVNWGEVIASLLKRYGSKAIAAARLALRDGQIEVVSATEDRAVRSAEIRFKYKIPYADAFCVELAFDSLDHVLVTADFDFKPAEQDISIEFLPPKPQ
jgi:predicted nucleic acid-binding protein